MTLNEKAKEIHADNAAKGFYADFLALQAITSKHGDPKLIKAFEQTFDAQRIALIQSEASEALEANRKNKKADVEMFKTKTVRQPYDTAPEMDFKNGFEKFIKDSEEDEIADTLIRLLDYAGFKGIDLDFHVATKLKYNLTRPHKHGKSI